MKAAEKIHLMQTERNQNKMMAADPNYYRQHETQQEIEELRGEKMGDSSSKMTGGKKKKKRGLVEGNMREKYCGRKMIA